VRKEAAVNWWEWWVTFWGGEPLTCRVPWWPLRRAVRQSELAAEAKILVLGDDVAGLTELLVYRGLSAVGVDPITQKIWGAPEETSQVQFVNRALVLPEQQFDLVLAHAVPKYRHDLQATAACLLSAQLLASLKPGGRLSLLMPQHPTWENFPAGHLRSCYQRHFQQFPVTSEVRFVGEAVHRLGTWRWLTGQQPRSGHLLIEARVPTPTPSKAEWQSIAIEAGRQAGPPCCLWVRDQLQAQQQAQQSSPPTISITAGAA